MYGKVNQTETGLKVISANISFLGVLPEGFMGTPAKLLCECCSFSITLTHTRKSTHARTVQTRLSCCWNVGGAAGCRAVWGGAGAAACSGPKPQSEDVKPGHSKSKLPRATKIARNEKQQSLAVLRDSHGCQARVKIKIAPAWVMSSPTSHTS